MADEIQLIATSDGAHYLLYGVDSDEIVTFSVQYYLEKFGARAVDWVQSLSLGFVSFMGADIWVHNSDDVPRNNFYGEQKYTEVGLVVNEQPQLVKLFDSIEINTSGNATIGDWEITSIIIPSTFNYPNGMSSKIPEGKFKKREGVLYAEFLRNMLSTDGTERAIDALRGEPLRGNTAYMILKNIDTEQVKLFKVSVNLTQSNV